MMLMVLFIVSGQVHTALNQSPYGMPYVPKRLDCYNDQAAAKLQDSVPPNAGGEAPYSSPADSVGE